MAIQQITLRVEKDVWESVKAMARAWAVREGIPPGGKTVAFVQRALVRAVEAERLAAVRAEGSREGGQ